MPDDTPVKRGPGRPRKPVGARLEQLDGTIRSALPGITMKSPEDSSCAHENAGMTLAPDDAAHGANSLIVRGGMARAVCQLVFLGYSNRAIGERLKFEHNVVDRFVKTDYFRALMVEVDTEMKARLDEHIFAVLENEILEMLHMMIQDAKHGTHSKRLKHRIRLDLMQMWERLSEVRKGRFGEGKVGAGKSVLTEVHERIAKLDAQGRKRTLIERITTTEPREAGDAPVAPPPEGSTHRGAENSARSGGGDGPLGEPGDAAGAAGAGEVARGDGSEGIPRE